LVAPQSFAKLLTKGHDADSWADPALQDQPLTRKFVARFECASRSLRGAYEKCGPLLLEHANRAIAGDPKLAPIIVHALTGQLETAAEDAEFDQQKLLEGLLAIFVARHVSPKRARDTALSALTFAPVLQRMDASTFDKVLREPLLRNAARNPEVVVHPLTTLLGSCKRSADMQACLDSVINAESKFGGVTQLIRSDDDANRRHAVSFLKLYGNRASSVYEDIGAVLREIHELVTAQKAQVTAVFVCLFVRAPVSRRARVYGRAPRKRCMPRAAH